MREEERTQELELTYRVVSSPGRLLTLKSADSDAYVGSCDHVYIIGSITDGQGSRTRHIRLDKLNNLCFLLGTHSAA